MELVRRKKEHAPVDEKVTLDPMRENIWRHEPAARVQVVLGLASDIHDALLLSVRRRLDLRIQPVIHDRHL